MMMKVIKNMDNNKINNNLKTMVIINRLQYFISKVKINSSNSIAKIVFKIIDSIQKPGKKVIGILNN